VAKRCVGGFNVLARRPRIPAVPKSIVLRSGPYLTTAAVRVTMSPNKKLIETYFATTDKSKLGPLLADDVEWVEWGDGVPASGAITRGKEAHVKNYGDDEIRAVVHRLTEEGNVVVAEGTAYVTKKDGRSLSVRFVNIFELENGTIQRKSSFGALIHDSV
jgi:ketosteroid isomerase-like protein